MIKLLFWRQRQQLAFLRLPCLLPRRQWISWSTARR